MSLIKNLREIWKRACSDGFGVILEKVQGCREPCRRALSMIDVMEAFMATTFVTIISADPGKVTCEMRVEKQHTNSRGTLHGGLTATLVDCITTMALVSTERALPGVSVDMNITYLSPAKLGDEVVITAQVLKQGKTLAFTSVDLTNKATGKLVAQGRHTKHLGS